MWSGFTCYERYLSAGNIQDRGTVLQRGRVVVMSIVQGVKNNTLGRVKKAPTCYPEPWICGVAALRWLISSFIYPDCQARRAPFLR